MANAFESVIEELAKPKPNQAIKGEIHAAKPGFNPFPTISMSLGRTNVTTDFKYDGANKKIYSIATPLWDPVNTMTRQRFTEAGKKKVLETPVQRAEIIQMDQARFPDKTYKYMISYTHLKRMFGSDGGEYLVRYGYFHGLTYMGVEWKYFKQDFDFHYEPVFETQPVLTGSSFDVNYGDIIRQIKVFHTPWSADEFNKSLKDIPFPNTPNVGINLLIGVEGAPNVYSVPNLNAFKTSSFQNLMSYAETLDESFIEETPEQEEPVTVEEKKPKK